MKKRKLLVKIVALTMLIYSGASFFLTYTCRYSVAYPRSVLKEENEQLKLLHYDWNRRASAWLFPGLAYLIASGLVYFTRIRKIVYLVVALQLWTFLYWLDHGFLSKQDIIFPLIILIAFVFARFLECDLVTKVEE